MNRRERRNMEKQLGLQKHRKGETTTAKFARWKDNQENGKRMMQEMENNVLASLQNQDDQKMSDTIQHLAESIAKRKKIPVIDAMVEAQDEYEKSRR